jgi:hypothetical protein
LIAPGDPIVLFRRLHEHTRDGDFDIAGKAAFESSP